MVTVTEDIDSYINYYELQNFFTEKSSSGRNFVRQKIIRAVSKHTSKNEGGNFMQNMDPKQ